jgi:hemolysin activation/secretion protein
MLACAWISLPETAHAQPSNPAIRPPERPTPSTIPDQPSPLQPPTTPINSPPDQSPSNPVEMITVKRFEIQGSSVFSQDEIDRVTAAYLSKPIAFDQLLKARDAITSLYADKGYITTGAYIPEDQPPVAIDGGIVKINIVEGYIEDIRVTGTKRLNPNYIRSRVQLATARPINQERLVDALRQLQLDPLVSNISAELSAGNQYGSNILELKVAESKSFALQASTENNRSSSIGSWQRRIQATQDNLLGLGDSLTLAYTNTTGSNTFDGRYLLPLSPRNLTLSLSAGRTSSKVVAQPFSKLDILSRSQYYEVSLRQPIIQRVTAKGATELALGITASRTEGKTSLLDSPFPLSVGANDQGETRISALRFFQEYIQRNNTGVFTLRSQFNFGLNALGSTINSEGPDSRFLSWRGQARLFQSLGKNSALVLRGDLQLADREMLSLEQFGIGGQGTVRGYRQDALLTDNGFVGSAELQLPIAQLGSRWGVIQIAPFVDVGKGWNQRKTDNPDPSTLFSTGLGLQWQAKDFSARVDWGIPLVSTGTRKENLQEKGIYFSLNYRFF